MHRARIVAVVVIVGAALAFVVWQHRRAGGAGSNEPGNKAIDYGLAPLLSAYHAPEGATPCETAYNALDALDRASRQRGAPTPWTTLPDRATFLQRCGALPPLDQQCLQPRYAAAHHDPCDARVRALVQHDAVFERNPKAPLD
jgi:hypothetical protein